ncbi:MAG: hypothetical protein A2836_02940 [Candidatus Taylorbacteria bacterium RIFCSPHIGHO2_01_FULL_45_63]|nr:MAG: hypothetical protein A2836_02940 [Candidatus Taylorbacteria bacterium RIFCSPHIGHO2_01_FULL_45_63]
MKLFSFTNQKQDTARAKTFKKVLVFGVCLAVVATALLAPIGTDKNVQAQIQPVIPGGYNQPYAPTGPVRNGDTCELWPINIGQCVMVGIAWVFEWALIPVLSWILALVGMLLDFSIRFALDTSNFTKITAIAEGWKIIRDLSNIFFIFILLWIAISTILQLSSHNLKQALTRIIIVALFVNFSLFISRAIMDAGNVVANGYYNAIVKDFPVNSLTQLPSLSSAFKGLMNIQVEYGEKATFIANVDDALKSTTNVLQKISGSSQLMNATLRVILISVAMYVFLMASFLFIARVIAFVFIMVFSPIGFIGFILPKTKQYADKWWTWLFDQTLVAPVFLILLYIVYKVMSSPAMIAVANVNPNGNLPLGFYFNYAILIGMLLLALKITKKLSGEMGAMVTKAGIAAGTIVAGGALALTGAGAAVAGRAVIGRMAAGAAAGEGRVGGTLKSMAANKEKGFKGAASRFIGQTGIKAVNRTAESSFDVRTSSLFQKGAGKLGLIKGAEAVGMSLKMKSAAAEAKKAEQKEKGTVGGYDRQKNERVKTEQEQARKMAAMLLPNQKALDKASGVLPAEAKKAEVERGAQKIEGDTTDNRGKIHQTIKGRVDNENNEKSKKEILLRAAKQREKDTTLTADQIGKAKEDKDRLTKEIEGHTNQIGNLNRDLGVEHGKLLDVVAQGMNTSVGAIEQQITDAKNKAKEQIEKAKGRVESFAQGIQDRSPTETIGRSTAVGTATGAAVGSVVPIVGTGIGAAVGAGVGAVRGAREAFGMSAEERKSVAEYIREKQRTGKLKEKPKGDKKGKESLDDRVLGSEEDDINSMSDEAKEKLRKLLGP